MFLEFNWKVKCVLIGMGIIIVKEKRAKNFSVELT
jgi:hypothetical protein